MYVYNTSGAPKQFFLRTANGSIQVLSGPGDSGRITSQHYPLLRITDIGIYIDYRGPEFHFKPYEHAGWQLREAPAEKCGSMTIDKTGNVLSVTCNKENYRSENGGQSWRKFEARPVPAASTPAT